MGDHTSMITQGCYGKHVTDISMALNVVDMRGKTRVLLYVSCLVFLMVFVSGCPIPIPPDPGDDGNRLSNLESCSDTDPGDSHFKIRNESGKELVLYTGTSAESAVSRIPNNSAGCYVKLSNVAGNTPIQVLFYDADDIESDLNPSSDNPFYNGGTQVVAPIVTRPITFAIPQSESRINTGTVALSYEGEGNVSVFLVNVISGSCPENLAAFRRTQSFDYITVLSSHIPATNITLPYEEPYRFMFAYWTENDLEITSCAVSSTIHQLTAVEPNGEEIIPPLFMPDYTLTIFNDYTSPVLIKIGSQNIADNEHVIGATTSTVQIGQSRQYIMNTGEYTFTAEFAGTQIEQQRITISHTTYAIWRVSGGGVMYLRDVDVDNDGLIDIRNLDMFNNIRYNLAGTSYVESSGSVGSTFGGPTFPTSDCPTDSDNDGVFLCGYELMRDLDFADDTSYASDTVNSTWCPDTSNSCIGDSSQSGFPGIGPASINFADGFNNDDLFVGFNGFNAIFEGNGNSISNFYSRNTANTNNVNIGLFAFNSGGTIRNIAVVNANVFGGTMFDTIGGLVGNNNSGGTITASYASGSADGGAGDIDSVGGLVGGNSGTITASYASGSADGGPGDFDSVGGLVGGNSGTITASYATGDADGGPGDFDSVGGLLGLNSGTITANYATGDVDGGDGNQDRVGGLVGNNNSGATITASYATGAADRGRW